ncbi:MAG: hypothetical protein QOH16_973 [Gaiellaceae bacterium]|jgi:hypothetical protein|nr:hypothetical protein [Gaiellaceae bacterium]
MSAAVASPVGPGRHRRLAMLALAATGGAAAIIGPFLAWQLLHQHRTTTNASALAPIRIHIGRVVSAQGLVDESGVELTRVALSGSGGLVDVRYRVIDPDKATSVHASENPPLILDQRSGAIVNQLLMAHMHHGRPKVGVTYYLIFMNPGDVIRRGSRVSIQLGGARVEGVTVQ